MHATMFVLFKELVGSGKVKREKLFWICGKNRQFKALMVEFSVFRKR